MVEFDLHRIYTKNGDGATIGILLSKARKAKYWFTIERPLFFKGNSNIRSQCCIAKGNYEAELFRSNKFQRAYYELKKIKNRDKILIHAGNVIDDLEGCIAIGSQLAKNIKIKNKINDYAVIYSEKAITDFYNFINPNLDYQEWYKNPNTTQVPQKIKINIYDDEETSYKLIKAYQKNFTL